MIILFSPNMPQSISTGYSHSFDLAIKKQPEQAATSDLEKMKKLCIIMVNVQIGECGPSDDRRPVFDIQEIDFPRLREIAQNELEKR